MTGFFTNAQTQKKTPPVPSDFHIVAVEDPKKEYIYGVRNLGKTTPLWDYSVLKKSTGLMTKLADMKYLKGGISGPNALNYEDKIHYLIGLWDNEYHLMLININNGILIRSFALKGIVNNMAYDKSSNQLYAIQTIKNKAQFVRLNLKDAALSIQVISQLKEIKTRGTGAYIKDGKYFFLSEKTMEKRIVGICSIDLLTNVFEINGTFVEIDGQTNFNDQNKTSAYLTGEALLCSIVLAHNPSSSEGFLAHYSPGNLKAVDSLYQLLNGIKPDTHNKYQFYLVGGYKKRKDSVELFQKMYHTLLSTGIDPKQIEIHSIGKPYVVYINGGQVNIF